MGTPESMDADDSEVDALRQEMHRKLGRCLVRLQQYELVMKELVARARVEGEVKALPGALAAQDARFANKTLGQVVGDLVERVLEEFDPESVPETSDDAPARIGIYFSMAFSGDTQADVKSSLEAFVKLRNELVHSFIRDHDIETATGLSAAIDDLDAAHTTIDQRFHELSDWYQQMVNLQQAVAGFVASDAGRELLFTSPLVDQAGEPEPSSRPLGTSAPGGGGGG